MLTLHHLAASQSERIVWLLEELGISYNLVIHQRDPVTLRAPPALKTLPGNTFGWAPFLTDAPDVSLGESAAIAQYILAKYDPKHTLTPAPSSPAFAAYWYWFVYTMVTLQPNLAGFKQMLLTSGGVSQEHAVRGSLKRTQARLLAVVDARLDESKFLAGEQLTAADCMMVYTLSTHRRYSPFSLKGYDHILRYLKTVGEREAYRRAIAKGDPGMEIFMGEEGPSKSAWDGR